MRALLSITISREAEEIVEKLKKETGKSASEIIDIIIRNSQETPKQKIRKFCNTLIREEMTKESRDNLLNKILENLDKI